ncbi:MAG: alpha/beta fold hydrolase [Bacteroidota bacterium]|nr:alpha/beta fold hydrolase [Bacteroidota bacterium]
MKNKVLLLGLLSILIGNAQEFAGNWNGQLGPLPLNLNFEQVELGYVGKLQSPKQSKNYASLDEVKINGDSISFKLSAFQIVYKGIKKGDLIEGTFTQGGMSNALSLKKGLYLNQASRPQTPKAPFDYKIEEVSFKNKTAGDIKLSGTLTLPKKVKNPPVAILISGSGPQDRDETLLDHKPFAVIADYFAKNGIAVLRYDDRGTAKSQGDHSTATSADFATDVYAAVAFLKKRKDINTSKIGLIGHSEGGMIAPMVIANQPKDIAFFISMAGTGTTGVQVLKTQIRKSALLQGQPEAAVEEGMKIMDAVIDEMAKEGVKDLSIDQRKKIILKTIETKRSQVDPLIAAEYSDQTAQSLADQFSTDWFVYFMNYNPVDDVAKIKVPTLIMNGSIDFQVIPEINVPPVEKALKGSGNNDVTVKIFPGLNHLFQNATTGAGSEYFEIEETIAPVVLETMATWINKRF